MSFYEKKILPKVLDLLCGSSPINYQRKKIVPKVSGNVLEIEKGELKEIFDSGKHKSQITYRCLTY